MSFDDVVEVMESGDDKALWELWSWMYHASNRAAADVFPDRPAGYRSAVRDIGMMAANLGTAVQCRLRGEIQTAKMYEEIAERIYQRLPGYAKW